MKASPSYRLPATLVEPFSLYRYTFMPLFVLAVVFIVFAPMFWKSTEPRTGGIAESYENSDLYQYYYPALHYGFGQMRAGELPLWNPRQLCGTPFFTDPRVGLFQPLNAVFFALPTEKAMAVHAFICLSLMGLFFVVFARATGVGYAAALIGGIVYAFSGLSAGAMSRPPMAAALAWMPLLLWAMREYGHRFDRATAVLSGLIGALFILSGSLACVVAASFFATPYLLWLVLLPAGSGLPKPWQRLKGLGLMTGIALGISSIQWISTAYWLIHLAHPAALIWNFDPAALAYAKPREFLAQILTPDNSPLPRVAYIGIVPLVLIPASLLHRHRWRETIFLAVALGGLTALSLVPASLIPFDFPREAFLAPATLCAAALAALGADRLLVPKVTFRSPAIWHVALLVIAASAILIFGFGGAIRGYTIAFLVVLLPFLLLRKRWIRPICGTLIALLLFTDLVTANKNAYRHPLQDAPDCYQRYATGIEVARGQALGARALVSARDIDVGLAGNLGMIFPVAMVGGVDLPLTTQQEEWWGRIAVDAGPLAHGSGKDISLKAPQTALLRFMAGRATLATPQGALYDAPYSSTTLRFRELAGGGNDLRVLVYDQALPRAYWVTSWRVTVGIPAAMDNLSSATFDSARECVVDALSPGITNLAATPPAATSAATPARTTATCSVEDVTPEHVSIHVNAPAAGITVLADTYAPGWTARLDGVRQPILRTNGLFRGIATPAGEHVIDFYYRPWTRYIAFGVCLVTFIPLVLAGLKVLIRP